MQSHHNPTSVMFMLRLSKALRFLSLDSASANSRSLGLPIHDRDLAEVQRELRTQFPWPQESPSELLALLPQRAEARDSIVEWIELTYDWVNSLYPWWKFYRLRLDDWDQKARWHPGSDPQNPLESIPALSQSFLTFKENVKRVRDSFIPVSSAWDNKVIHHFRVPDEPEVSWNPQHILEQSVEMCQFQHYILAIRKDLEDRESAHVRELAIQYHPFQKSLRDSDVPPISALPVPHYFLRNAAEFEVRPSMRFQWQHDANAVDDDDI